MARKNITIPQSLDERMDRFPYVNWSKVASNAFKAWVYFHDLQIKQEMEYFRKLLPWNQQTPEQRDEELRRKFWEED